MSLEVISIILLFLMFVIGSFFSINMGILGFVMSFLFLTFNGTFELDDVYASFPADLFILLVGVTYLFSIIQKNGTLNLITSLSLRMIRGNVAMIPWLFFFLAMILSAIGTSSIAVAGVLAGIGFGIAYQNNINPLLMGLMIQAGSTAGAFSPLNIFGIIVNGVMKSEGFSFSESIFLTNIVIFNLFLVLIAFIVLGGYGLLKNNSLRLGITPNSAITAQELTKIPQITKANVASLIGLALLLVFVIGFDQNIGFAALTIGLLLSLLTHKTQGDVLKEIPWSVIVMVSGIVTYVGIIEQIGTMDLMTQLVAKIGNPATAALFASYIGGIISAFASTTGFLSAIIPLAVPILNDPSISAMGVVTAISVSSSIVDLSPFSTVGALFLANVKGISESKFFKQLLIVSVLFIVLGPLTAWLVFVVIGGMF